MKALFFHGGPGFNSNPERNLLSNRYKVAGIEILFWDEPSKLRLAGHKFVEENAFQNYLNSAELFLLANYSGEKLLIICHSFGANVVTYLSKKHPDKIAKIFFFSSDLLPAKADLNIFKFTRDDYKKNGDDRHLALSEVIKNYTATFDENSQRGFQLVSANPNFFTYYWYNKSVMMDFLTLYTPPDYALDVEAFMLVRQSLFQTAIKKSKIPAIAIYGSEDAVICKKSEIEALKESYANLQIFEIPQTGHYPHIESFDQCLKIITGEVARESR